MQEQRFLAAAVEDVRVAPLEPRDDLALAGFLGNQVADGFLRGRGGRRGAQVDAFGAAEGLPRGDVLGAPTTWWGKPIAAVTEAR